MLVQGGFMTKNSELTPFRIDVAQADLDDLYARLANIRWPDELPGAGWDYGVAKSHLRELVRYWQTGFEWRAVEARLNELPQFTTVIDGQRVHLAHLRSGAPDAVPLLMTHGWPSTIADFLDLAGPLTEPQAHGALPVQHRSTSCCRRCPASDSPVRPGRRAGACPGSLPRGSH